MKIFLDTANLEDIKKATEMSLIDGVTTNPSLVAREGKTIKEAIVEISRVVDGPLSAEVMSLDYDGMVKEAKELAAISDNIVVKIPMCTEGLRAVKTLTSLGIKTNVTLIFSIQQGVLAAKAGATYISPFVGRLDDIGQEGMDLIRGLMKAMREYNFSSEIIAASVRNQKHIAECIECGADIATIPYSELVNMTKHQLTDKGIERFIEDYKKINK